MVGDGLTDGWMDGCMEMDGWMEMDGNGWKWMDRCMDVWMNGWMNG